MKINLQLILGLVAVATLSAAPTKCSNGTYLNGEAPDILNAKLAPKTKELCFSSFSVMHSGISRTPLYVGEHLTRTSVGSKSDRTNDFHAEEKLGEDERAELSDYARSGYDRGHMAPSADMPTEKAQHESFTLANMIPQAPENNRGVWASIERSTRDLTNQYGEVYVVTGVIFTGSNVRRIGGRVLVPTMIYKAIYIPSIMQGAAYLVDNTDNSGHRVVNIASLEAMSGVRVFQKMPVAAKKSGMDLPAPALWRNKSPDYGLLGINQSHLNSLSLKMKEKTGQVGECGAKKYCREMTSCSEAKFYLNSCGVTSLDGNGDGTPCEKLCK